MGRGSLNFAVDFDLERREKVHQNRAESVQKVHYNAC